MHDIFHQFSRHASPLAYYRMDRMFLSPKHWKTCRLPLRLRWTPVKFDAQNASAVPSDKHGVYSFVVKPNIADHTDVAYLIYVGKVRKQSFRARYTQYIAHFRKGEKSNWFHVATFLHKWQGYLWFYWAPVPARNKIDSTERMLISSFLPPGNHKFEGKVKKEIKLVLN
jgi:hypothetical protein